VNESKRERKVGREEKGKGKICRRALDDDGLHKGVQMMTMIFLLIPAIL
jgi:hypothetical protein